MSWEILLREKKCNQMWYMLYMWFILSKTIWEYLWIHSCWLKTSWTFFKLLKTLHKIYSAKILLLPDIFSVYYLEETDLISRSIWEKYSAKILGRNIHLMVRTFTGTKYRRFKYGIPARLQNLILQCYVFPSIAFFFYNHFFDSFLFSLSSVCNVSCLFETTNAEKRNATG